MTTLLFEPFGGVSGDMFLAALLDLGDERFGLEDLRGLAEALLPGECRVETAEVRRGSLRATTLTVRTPESAAPPHRHLSDLLALVDQSSLGETARARAGAVLRRLAEAEARVHGSEPEEVHFHEVGAVDTLIDVCGAALALERLGVRRVLSSAPYVGGGTVACAHGEMPVPAPGTEALLRGIPTRHGPGGERVTPTGAALLAELVDLFDPAETLVRTRTGCGAGARDPEDGPPNLLRVSLCAERMRPEEPRRRTAWKLECNLDDATGEEVGFLLGELRGSGALEVWSAPVQMKKDRPGAVVTALCRDEARAALEAVCFAHSPTLGLRWSLCERAECDRVDLVVELEGRRVRVQRRVLGAGAPGPFDLAVEYDDLAELARATGRPLRAIEAEVLARAREALEEPGGEP